MSTQSHLTQQLAYLTYALGRIARISWTTTAGETYEIEYFDGSSFVAPTSINAAAGTAIQSGIPVGSTYKWHIRTTVNGCVAASWTDSSVFSTSTQSHLTQQSAYLTYALGRIVA